jgi:hypothetical protein
MSLKEQLDIVWNSAGVACPNHLVRWNAESNVGYKHRKSGLFFVKGTAKPLKTIRLRYRKK